VLALTTGRIVELAAITAVLYLLMSWPLSILSRRFEHGRETHS
jgi:ABC-type amino acid transport system permease subunit